MRRSHRALTFIAVTSMPLGCAVSANDDDGIRITEASLDPDPGEGLEPACNLQLTATPTVTTPVRFGTRVYNPSPGPLFAIGDRVQVFLDDTTMWQTGSRADFVTQAVPPPMSGAKSVRGFRSLSGPAVVLFAPGIGSEPGQAVTFDGQRYGTPIAIPCSGSHIAYGSCSARATADGRVWIHSTNGFYEQVGSSLQSRGKSPTEPVAWEVDRRGDILVAGRGQYGTDHLPVWRLSLGAGAWSKPGGITEAMKKSLDPRVEEGFAVTSAVFAPDGALHLLSNAHCLGTYGCDRNRAQFHLRSRDYVNWELAQVPALVNGEFTWGHAALHAKDYDRVSFMLVSSRVSRSYPGGWFNVVNRCRAADGRITFAVAGKLADPYADRESFTRFSDTGVPSALTPRGITQLF